jgi:hypothetical protein
MPTSDQAAAKQALDFTGVRDGGGLFNKKRQLAGDYRAKVTKVVSAPAKKDGKMQWLFTIQVGTGSYPYYCKLVPEQLWKLRNLLMAAGLNVPKQRVSVDPNKVVNREIAVTLDDDEYDDGDKVHKQSAITATFPLAELDEDAQRDDEDDEDEEDEAPQKTQKRAKVVEDEDDDEEEQVKPKAKAKAKKKRKVAKDEDLDELEIDL